MSKHANFGHRLSIKLRNQENFASCTLARTGTFIIFGTKLQCACRKIHRCFQLVLWNLTCLHIELSLANVDEGIANPVCNFFKNKATTRPQNTGHKAAAAKRPHFAHGRSRLMMRKQLKRAPKHVSLFTRIPILITSLQNWMIAENYYHIVITNGLLI